MSPVKIWRSWFNRSSKMATAKRASVEVNRCLFLSGDSCSVKTETTEMSSHDFWPPYSHVLGSKGDRIHFMSLRFSIECYSTEVSI